VDGVIRTLVARGLIEEASHDGESGSILYRTTSYFLERLGLRGVDELPELAPFLPELDTLDEGDSGDSVSVGAGATGGSGDAFAADAAATEHPAQ